ncbi:MAG: hypothetical protein CL570_05775 [Alphaproteobacteria bacterium]|nr:hypothetical protein [Alphaproteobacteria bacterium]HCQ70585.1 hypothetical protein [Rhodospirillaceae bacterium]
MKNKAHKGLRTKNRIDRLKFKLNQILPIYISAKLQTLSNVYGFQAQRSYCKYTDAKKKYAMISQLIHILETSHTPQPAMAYAMDA